MSIYKDNPQLSLDFEILPFNIALSRAVEKYLSKVLEIEEKHFDVLQPSSISFKPAFNTPEKRLFFSPENQKMMLGCSNTQHNCGVPHKLGNKE